MGLCRRRVQAAAARTRLMPAPSPRRRFGQNLRSLFWWRRGAEDVVEEMALHVDLRAQELEAEGVPAATARARAIQEVGRPDSVAPIVDRLAHSADRGSAIRQWLDEARIDLCDAWRSCRRAPGLTLLTLATMAIGLGANAAIFGVVNVALLAPLPFDPGDTLVRVREFRRLPDGTARHGDASRRTADAISLRPDLFLQSVAVSGVGRTFARDGGAVRVEATRVGPGFTAVVGVAPILGRGSVEVATDGLTRGVSLAWPFAPSSAGERAPGRVRRPRSSTAPPSPVPERVECRTPRRPDRAAG